jgi:hypothetical protein
VNGAELTSAIRETAALTGWRLSHLRPARSTRGWRTPLEGDAGFPDLVLARRGVVLLPEVKGDGDRLRNEQAGWLTALGAPAPAVALAGIVTPRELDGVLRFLGGRSDLGELERALATSWDRTSTGRRR